MKILYVHFRISKTEAQAKEVADKAKMLKEVSTRGTNSDCIFLQMLIGMQTQGSPEIYTRDRNSISDHLFNFESSSNSKHNEKRFDLIDIVVLEGDPNVLPWESKNAKIK